MPADVMDSAKGWAGSICFNERLVQVFKRFFARKDTFSLGVCNGCQLMALLGVVPLEPQFASSSSTSGAAAAAAGDERGAIAAAAEPRPEKQQREAAAGGDADGPCALEMQPRFVHNESGRFESRWVSVKIADKTPAVMLKGT